jgi:hypothetical protein
MQTYTDLIELARICREQALTTKAAGVATVLRTMAKEYERRAAEVNGNARPVSRI